MARRRFSRAIRAGRHLKTQYPRHNTRRSAAQGSPQVFPKLQTPSPVPQIPPPKFQTRKGAKRMGPASAPVPKHIIPSSALGGSGCDHNAGSHDGPSLSGQQQARPLQSILDKFPHFCAPAPLSAYRNKRKTDCRHFSSLASHRRPMHRQLRYQAARSPRPAQPTSRHQRRQKLRGHCHR